MAPRNFRQPFNWPQFHANGKNALRSLTAITETRDRITAAAMARTGFSSTRAADNRQTATENMTNQMDVQTTCRPSPWRWTVR